MSLEASSAEAHDGNVLPHSLRRGSTLGGAVDIAVVLAPALADGEPAILLPPRWRWGGVQRLTACCGKGTGGEVRGSNEYGGDGELRAAGSGSEGGGKGTGGGCGRV